MNKYIVLSATALAMSLVIGCQNCGYKTAHSSRYETLVGKTRLESPQTNCRYNVCSVNNTCNTCSPCNTQMLANNGQFTPAAYSQNGYQNGWYEQNTSSASSVTSSLLEAPEQQTAQEQTPLHWRRVTEEEQQYANSSTNSTSVGVASALSAPAFGSPAPAPNIAPRYPNSSPRAARGVASALETPEYPASAPTPQYPPRHPNSSPRAAMGVASALTPGRPMPSSAPQYSGQTPGQYGQYPGQYGQTPGQYGQYPGQYGQDPGQYGQDPGQYPSYSPRATAGVDSGVNVPNHPLPRQYANQYPTSNQYPGSSPRVASGVNPSYSPSYGAPASGTDAEPIRWRHATEEEQQYYNSPQRAAAGNAGYGADEPLTVPVYQGNNDDATQMPGNPSTPSIDPNALPMPESPVGTF